MNFVIRYRNAKNKIVKDTENSRKYILKITMNYNKAYFNFVKQ